MQFKEIAVDRYEKATQNRAKAAHLNQLWKVGAVQARYRETGNWYHRLNQFPAALFDATGYILFRSEEDLKALTQIHILKQISVPHGISSLPGYVKVLQVAPPLLPLTDEIESPEKYWEGALRRIVVNEYERDDSARRECISCHGLTCQVCGFNFESKYGEIGKGFVHIHHLLPLSEIRANYSVNPRRDLAPVCANCHAMIHRRSPPFSIEELRLLTLAQERDR